MPECVCAFVAILGRIRRMTNASAVEDEKKRAHEQKLEFDQVRGGFISTVSKLQVGFYAFAPRQMNSLDVF